MSVTRPQASLAAPAGGIIARFAAWLADWDWRVRAPVAFFVVALLAGLVLTGLCYWLSTARMASLWFPLSVLSPAVAAALAGMPRARGWRRRLDGRVGAMLAATALAVWGTLVGFLLGADEATPIVKDIFVNWTASVIFWALVGLAVTIVSIARPEAAHYEERALNLFGRAEGEHIRFIIDQLPNQLAHYAELVERVVTILDYHPGEDKFLLQIDMRSVVRGYLPDRETRCETEFSIWDVATPPPGAVANELVRLRVPGQQPITRQAFDPPDGTSIRRQISPAVPRHDACDVESQVKHWEKALSGANEYTPARFTRRFRLTVHNLLPNNGEVYLKIRHNTDPTWVYHHNPLKSGEEKVLCEGSDIRPDEILYDFRLSSLPWQPGSGTSA